MNGMQFYRKVQGHPDLEWLGCEEKDEDGRMKEEDDGRPHPSSFILHPCVYVRYDAGRSKPGTGRIFAIPISEILEREWDEFEGVLTQERPADALRHQTRIVGYYSMTNNWNSSKLAELRDRQLGRERYRLPAQTPAGSLEDSAMPEGTRA